MSCISKPKRKAVRIAANQFTPCAYLTVAFGRVLSQHQDFLAALNHWHRWQDIYPDQRVMHYYPRQTVIPEGTRIRRFQSLNGFLVILPNGTVATIAQDKPEWPPKTVDAAELPRGPRRYYVQHVTRTL